MGKNLAPKPSDVGDDGGPVVDPASVVLEITVKGETRKIAPGNIPMMEKVIVRKATGLPFEAFYKGGDLLGEDSLMVLWWLAGRGTDPLLTFDRAATEWPTGLTPGDIEVVEVTATTEDSDPQS